MHWKLILIFIFCMFLYAAIGGIAYHFIETSYEKDHLVSLHAKINGFLSSHPCMNASKIKTISRILDRMNEGGLMYLRPEIVNVSNWDIGSAIFMASQIVGAVGYGNITPRTVGGKIFTVFYAIIGIPLFIIFAFAVGRPIARFIRFLEKRFCLSCSLDDPTTVGQRNPKRSQAGNTMLRRIWVYLVRILMLFIVGVIFFVLIPAAIFTAIETWRYGESVYFCFISVLSIGFGDYVPGDAASQNYRNWYRLCTAFWMYLSVAFFVVVFYPIEEAMDFKRSVNKPLDLHEPDPQVFQDINKALHINNHHSGHENNLMIPTHGPPHAPTGEHPEPGLQYRHSDSHPHSHPHLQGHSNQGFDGSCGCDHDHAASPSTHSSIICTGQRNTVYPALPTSDIASGAVTNLTVS
jgi:hypothetical protein